MVRQLEIQEVIVQFNGESTIAARRSLWAFALVGWLTLSAFCGCSLTGQNSQNTRPPKDSPQTVGEWMKQPRVEP